jgi:hypothetical protein
MPRTFPPRAVWNVLLAAFTLRWVGLDRHSLWLDEGVTWAWATAPTLGDTVFAEPNHPPVWWVVSRAWVGLFGDAEESLRAPAAIAGVVAVYLGWLLALRLLSPDHAPRRGGFRRAYDGGAGARQAIWFAAFLATATYFIQVSQEARMYALLLAESLGLALLYLRWLDRDDRASLVGYAALAALALHTHYFAIWPIAALAAHALYLSVRTRGAADPAERVRLLPFTLANAVAGLLFVPWLVYVVTHYHGLALGSPDRPFQLLAHLLWRIGTGPALVFVDAERLKSGVGAVLAAEAPMLIATTIVWLTPLLFGVRRLWRLPGTGPLVLFSVGLPVLGLLAIYPWLPFLQDDRYVVFLAPWLWLTAVVGATGARRWLKPVLLTGLCALVAVGLVAYHFVERELAPKGEGARLGNVTLPREASSHPDDPTAFLHHGHPFGKEPWREVSTFVHRYARDGDLVVLCPGYLHFVWDYYGRKRPGGPLPVLRLSDMPPEPEALLAEHGDLLAEYDRVFLIVSHAVDRDPDHAYRSLHAGLERLWGGVETVPPIPFLRSWSVYVSVFSRR